MAREAGLWSKIPSLLAITALALAGCVETDESGYGASSEPIFSDRPLSGSGSQHTEIQELAIQGDRYTAGTVQLSPNRSFRIGWRLAFSAKPALELYLSPSTSRFHPQARTLYRCDERSGTDLCRQSVTCEYGNDNRLRCSAYGGRSTHAVPMDVAGLINERAHLILKLRSRAEASYSGSADTQSLAVRLN